MAKQRRFSAVLYWHDIIVETGVIILEEIFEMGAFYQLYLSL